MFAKSFKSFVTLKVEDVLSLTQFNQLEDVNFAYSPAGDYDLATMGLISFEEGFAKEFHNLQVINVGSSFKKVNKKKVKRLTKQKILEMKATFETENPAETFKISKEELKIIEGNIAFSLLPETEVDEVNNYVFFDKQEGLVYITNTTKKASEEITNFIRSVLETFPVGRIVLDEEKVTKGFAKMISGDIETRFDLGNFVKLEDEDGIVTWTKESLYQSNASDLLETGKKVVSIGLTYDGILPLIVDTELTVKGLKWPKEFKQEGSFEATSLLCINEIRGLISDLMEETVNK